MIFFKCTGNIGSKAGFCYSIFSMNEFIFTIQVLLIFGFVFGALRLGSSALTALIAILALVANLFVLKQIDLFGFHVTASDTLAIGCLLGLNVLQEYFSKDEAQKATWICFFSMLFFTLISLLHLHYVPSPEDTTQGAFLTLLSPTPRLLAASMFVFFIVQRVDILFFAFLKNVLPHTRFALRVTISLIFSQFLDTVLFSFVGLYGIVNSIIDIILFSFIVKLVVIFCFGSFTKWVKP